MTFLERLPLPKQLSSRVWLISLPSALVSFERRQSVPKLPIGPLRFLGIPLIASGVALGAWAWRRPDASLEYSGPLARLAGSPATAGGILVIGGLGLLLRSAVLTAYALGITAAATTDTVTVQDPQPADFIGGQRV